MLYFVTVSFFTLHLSERSYKCPHSTCQNPQSNSVTLTLFCRKTHLLMICLCLHNCFCCVLIGAGRCPDDFHCHQSTWTRAAASVLQLTDSQCCKVLEKRERERTVTEILQVKCAARIRCDVRWYPSFFCLWSDSPVAHVRGTWLHMYVFIPETPVHENVCVIYFKMFSLENQKEKYFAECILSSSILLSVVSYMFT